MKIGGEYEFDNVFPHHFEKLAEEAGFGKALLKARLTEMAEVIPGALDRMDVRHQVADDLSALIVQRCQIVVDRLRSTRPNR